MALVARQRRLFDLSERVETLSVCILHRSRWHVTAVEKPLDEVVDTARDAFRRSGLPVQIRDADGTILYEINEQGETPAQSPAAAETHTW